MSKVRTPASAAARKRQKIAAFSAAGIVLIAGATVSSFAAWTDTEWVYGGADTEPNVTTSIFEVNQNTTALTTAASWVNEETSPGGKVDFGMDATALVPDEPVYGYVRLRTTVESLPGSVTLSAATQGAGEPDLFAALRYGARIVASPADCTAAGFAAATAPDASLVAPGSLMSTAGADAFPLDGGTLTVPGAEKTICFELELPAPADDALQGDGAQAVWSFTSISVTP